MNFSAHFPKQKFDGGVQPPMFDGHYPEGTVLVGMKIVETEIIEPLRNK